MYANVYMCRINVKAKIIPHFPIIIRFIYLVKWESISHFIYLNTSQKKPEGKTITFEAGSTMLPWRIFAKNESHDGEAHQEMTWSRCHFDFFFYYQLKVSECVEKRWKCLAIKAYF